MEPTATIKVDKPDQQTVPEQKPVPLTISQNSKTFNETFAKLVQ